jgi:5-methylcytosine-specific restriction endonuclease McrA
MRACGSCGRTFHGTGARCYTCEPRAQGQRRAGRIERGYDADYQRARVAVIGGRCTLQMPGCTGWADTADHVVPVSQGGAGGALRGACLSCNSARGART